MVTTFKSSEKKINAGRKDVYGFISDINNFTSLVPEGKVSKFEAQKDSCRFNAEGIGQVIIRIVSSEPGKNVVFESDGSLPFHFNVLIDLEDSGTEATVMKIVLTADLNMIMQAVAKKPLKEGVEVVASQLSEHLNSREWG
jgi:carbon monoxide dehydrogenase subunit G